MQDVLKFSEGSDVPLALKSDFNRRFLETASKEIFIKKTAVTLTILKLQRASCFLYIHLPSHFHRRRMAFGCAVRGSAKQSEDKTKSQNSRKLSSDVIRHLFSIFEIRHFQVCLVP